MRSQSKTTNKKTKQTTKISNMETSNDNMIDAGVAVAATGARKRVVAKKANTNAKVQKTIKRAKNDENQVILKFNQYNPKYVNVHTGQAGAPMRINYEKVIPRSTFVAGTDKEVAEGLKKTRYANHINPSNLHVKINGIRRKLAEKTGKDYTCKHKFGRARKVLVK